MLGASNGGKRGHGASTGYRLRILLGLLGSDPRSGKPLACVCLYGLAEEAQRLLLVSLGDRTRAKLSLQHFCPCVGRVSRYEISKRLEAEGR